MPLSDDLATAVQYANVLADSTKTYRFCFKQALEALTRQTERVEALERQNQALRDELRRYTAAVVSAAL